MKYLVQSRWYEIVDCLIVITSLVRHKCQPSQAKPNGIQWADQIVLAIALSLYLY